MVQLWDGDHQVTWVYHISPSTLVKHTKRLTKNQLWILPPTCPLVDLANSALIILNSRAWVQGYSTYRLLSGHHHTATNTRLLSETEEWGASWYWKDNFVYSDPCQDTGPGARNYILNFSTLCQYSLICSATYISQKLCFPFLQKKADVGILSGNSHSYI